jgi:hypothetical protein
MRAPKELPLADEYRSDRRVSNDDQSRDIEWLADSNGEHSEEAFRYLLDVERRRSQMSGRPFLLLLITFVPGGADNGAIPTRVAARVFAALSGVLRDTDLVGWHSDAHTVGAVLTQSGSTPPATAMSRVRARVWQALDTELPTTLAKQLRLRLCQITADLEVWN